MPSSAEKPGAGSTGDIHRSLGFFITLIIEHLPEGGLRISHSRWHRKGLAPIELSGEAGALPAKPAANPWLQLWAPHRLAWWIAIFFVIGSACFAVASFASNWPQYCPAVLVHGSVTNRVFFIGSQFFTTAAWLQLEEAVNGDVADIFTSPGRDRPAWRWFAWKPRNAGYSASLVQFAGTVEHQLVADRGEYVPRFALCIGEDRFGQGRGKLARAVGLVHGILVRFSSCLLANDFLGHR